jgi:hypothetical protein
MTYDTLKFVQDAYYCANHNKPKLTKDDKYSTNQAPIKDWLNGSEGILFLDESHLLGNSGTRRSECMDMIVPFFKYRYCFSATPWDDFSKSYMQLKILDQALVYGLSYSNWLSKFYNIGTRYSKW